MPSHNFDPPKGRIERLTVRSHALENNLLGDPAIREVSVYLPEGYDASDADYPLLVGLAGFTSSGPKLLSWQSFGESLPQRLDRLVARGEMGPVVLALPDGFTSLGGNQYVDSPVTGNWEAFLLDEMLPRIEDTFRVRRGARNRAVFGKSSGGYGALVQGLRHGRRWGAVACHSGDMAFELVYLRDMPRTLDTLARDGGDVVRFLDRLAAADKIRGEEMHALMTLAMAATYDPQPDKPRGIGLPVDPHTCQLDERRWQRWLEHDPLRLIDRPEMQANLASLGGLLLDCGSRDQYFLHYGARAFSRKLRSLGIDHVYEEFEDDHSGIDYRLDRSLPFLYLALT